MRAAIPLLVLLMCCVGAGCHSAEPSPEALREPESAPAKPVPQAAPDAVAHPIEEARPSPLENDAIVICGHRVHTGTRVVLWTEAPHYDASSERPRFPDPTGKIADKTGLHYQPGRLHAVPNPEYVPAGPENQPDERTALQKQPTVSQVAVPADSHDSQLVADVVDQFVLHYDVCGLSRTCFRVLQDERMLSVHFMLDIDGTIYQTLDLRDTAWHATKSNPRSIGIEIANMGAYPLKRANALDDWYRRDTIGTYIQIPARVQESGVLTPGFVGRPARGPAPIVGVVQGEELEQYDLTPEQYASLVKLAAALCREFPKITPDAPRDENGQVLDHVLDDDEWRDVHGILGHFHVQKNKTDPGPAFDWEPFLAAVRARIEQLDRPGG